MPANTTPATVQVRVTDLRKGDVLVHVGQGQSEGLPATVLGTPLPARKRGKFVIECTTAAGTYTRYSGALCNLVTIQAR